MATNAESNLTEMLDRYAPKKLIMDKFLKENYMFKTVDKDKSWKGGEYQIPWELSEYSDIQMGGLVDESEMGTPIHKLGKETVKPEMWGALKFHEKDLKRYGSLEQSFLKLLPSKLERFIARMSDTASVMILNGGAKAVVTADGTVAGILAVNKPQRFVVGERIEINDDDSAIQVGYVTVIDMNAKTLEVRDARSGGSVIDLSAYEVANNAKVYVPGSSTENFNSIQNIVLPASLGGSDTLHGVNKSASPLLQSQVIDGSSWSSTNILDKLYDLYFEIKELGKVRNGKIVVPYYILRDAAKKAETKKEYSAGDRKVTHGFTEVSIIGAFGEMNLVAVPEMDQDKIFVLDFDHLQLAGDEFFEKKRHFNNEFFYMTRKTTGYEYICDVSLQAQLIATKNSCNACVHSISY